MSREQPSFAIPPHWAINLIVHGLPYERSDDYIEDVVAGKCL